MSHSHTWCLYKGPELTSLSSSAHSKHVLKVLLSNEERFLINALQAHKTRAPLHWRHINDPTGHLRMKLLVWCLLLLLLCSSSEEMVVENNRSSRWQSRQMAKRQHIIRNLKRHSDGTFTSDFTNHLDKIKAKDFVEWLASIKREGCRDEFLQTVADV